MLVVDKLSLLNLTHGAAARDHADPIKKAQATLGFGPGLSGSVGIRPFKGREHPKTLNIRLNRPGIFTSFAWASFASAPSPSRRRL
jgi:hypothetical protein